MKKGKRIILFFIALTITLSTYFTYKHTRAESQPIIQKQFKQEINEQSIIDRLQGKATLVSLEGNVAKTYGQTDDMFNTGWNWLDRLGNKQYIIKAKGRFAMGMDLSQIKQEDILLAGDTVIVKLPEVTLQSLELPYEKMEIHNEDGLLRKKFTQSQIKSLHKEMSYLVKKDIKSDHKLYVEANKNAENFVRIFLMLMPGIEQVKFAN